MPEEKNTQELLQKYITGAATEEEVAWVETWYARLQDQVSTVSEKQLIEDERQNRQMLERRLLPGRTTRLWTKVAAAVVLTVVSTAVYRLAGHRSVINQPVTATCKQDITPGSDKAVLTLANGQRILLDDAKQGQLANQSGFIVSKTATGQIVYTAAKTGPDKAAKTGPDKNAAPAGGMDFNIITTPRGGQFQVVLPDGTHVWLDAASSLKYPIAFTGPQREVQLSGQAFFQVAGDKTKPFKVVSRCNDQTQTVEVLGTSFNINAYQDETYIRTTLLEGEVRVDGEVAGRNLQKKLRPGQQTVLDNKGLLMQEADTEEAIAWKNGYFVFDEETLASVMRKISRWYDVEVEYKDKTLLPRRFNGTVSRYAHVSQVLKVLELTQAAHFTITGSRIVISQ